MVIHALVTTHPDYYKIHYMGLEICLEIEVVAKYGGQAAHCGNYGVTDVYIDYQLPSGLNLRYC